MQENENLDFLTDDSSYGKKIKKRKGKKTVILIIIAALVVIAAGFAGFAAADIKGAGFGRGKETEMTVKQGSSSAAIASELKKTGAVKSTFLFRVYTRLKGYDSKFNYGTFKFKTDIGFEKISQMLINGGEKVSAVSVKIPEGATVDEIAGILEKKGVCKKEDFINEVQSGRFDYDFVNSIPTDKVHYRLEGYLFPDTYAFYNDPSKNCAHLAVDKMLLNLKSKLSDDILNKISAGKYNLHQVMTMASIVELESGGVYDESCNVAAVFYNRLESSKFSTLGSSPTRKYPYGDGAYNTYTAKGLPPGPLCSPSISSIKAAVNPTQNFDYYYFVTDKSMKFYYRKTLAEHNAIIAKLKAENNWIYED